MIAELAKLLPKFSEVNHTQCFLHIVNLVAKLIIKQFDVPQKREDEHLDAAEQDLHNLAGDIGLEEQESVEEMTQYQIAVNIDSETKNDEEEDNIDGWVDKMTLLSCAEHEQVQEDIRPVKLVLIKVRHE
jgi:hypothetical protein